MTKIHNREEKNIFCPRTEEIKCEKNISSCGDHRGMIKASSEERCWRKNRKMLEEL